MPDFYLDLEALQTTSILHGGLQKDIKQSAKSHVRQNSTCFSSDLEERTRKGRRYLQILESGGHLSC
jgi:hypothetical protein